VPALEAPRGHADVGNDRWRGSAAVAAQAERVPGGIEQHPDVVLRLRLGDPRTERHGVGDGRVEVVDLDVEVHHRPLPAGLGGHTGAR
jgi:hypothetical protein